jgi:hypothetical protein
MTVLIAQVGTISKQQSLNEQGSASSFILIAIPLDGIMETINIY